MQYWTQHAVRNFVVWFMQLTTQNHVVYVVRNLDYDITACKLREHMAARTPWHSTFNSIHWCYSNKTTQQDSRNDDIIVASVPGSPLRMYVWPLDPKSLVCTWGERLGTRLEPLYHDTRQWSKCVECWEMWNFIQWRCKQSYIITINCLIILYCIPQQYAIRFFA